VPHFSPSFGEMWEISQTSIGRGASVFLDQWHRLPVDYLVHVPRWRREAATAYAEGVVKPYRQIVLSALLLVLLVTQAGSSICGAQCIQHSLPQASTHSCHEMQSPQGPAVQTCSTAAHVICAIDLLQNNQTKPLLMERSLLQPVPKLYAITATSFTPAEHPLRSSGNAPPLLTPLRV
jgi:hypothetical protein